MGRGKCPQMLAMVQQLSLFFVYVRGSYLYLYNDSSTRNSICKHGHSILKRPRLFEFSSNLKNCCDIQSFLSTTRWAEFYIYPFFIIETFLWSNEKHPVRIWWKSPNEKNNWISFQCFISKYRQFEFPYLEIFQLGICFRILTKKFEPPAV